MNLIFQQGTLLIRTEEENLFNKFVSKTDFVKDNISPIIIKRIAAFVGSGNIDSAINLWHKAFISIEKSNRKFNMIFAIVTMIIAIILSNM